MGMEDLGDPVAVAGREIGEQEALVGRDPHARREFAEDLPQRRLELKPVTVDDPAILDVEAVEVFSIPLLEPADVVVEAMDVGGMAGGKRLAEVFLHLRPESLQAHGVDRVLQSRGLAVGAIAVVALHLDDRLGDTEDILGGNEPQSLGQSREGLGGAWRHPHSATGDDVVAEDLSMFMDDDEAEVVGIDVGAVVLGKGEGGLELPRQVGGTVNRLDRVGATGDAFLLPRLRIGEPDLVVGASPRREMDGEFVELGLHLVADGVSVDRRRAAHDVAFDVAAGGERRHLVGVNLLHEGLEVPLHDAVVLDRLPGRQPDRAVADLVSHVDRGEELGGGELSPRHAGADHEADLADALGPLPALPLLAVVLLVGAEVLEELNAPLSEAGGPVDEFLGDVPTEVVARGLEALDGGQLRSIGGLLVVGHRGSRWRSVRLGWGRKVGPLRALRYARIALRACG